MRFSRINNVLHEGRVCESGPEPGSGGLVLTSSLQGRFGGVAQSPRGPGGPKGAGHGRDLSPGTPAPKPTHLLFHSSTHSLNKYEPEECLPGPGVGARREGHTMVNKQMGKEELQIRC